MLLRSFLQGLIRSFILGFKMRNTSKIIFVLLFFLVVSLPEIYKKFRIADFAAPLKGAFVYAAEPVLNSTDWYSGTYQKQYGAYYNDSLSLRSFLIRLRNQLDFALFNQTHASDTQKCNDGFLEAISELDFNLGKLTAFKGAISEDTEMIKFLQDTLSKRNIHLCILFAPTKASYYSDKIPSWYVNKKKDTSDYEFYIQECNKRDIHYIDFDKYFLQLKPKNETKLYSKYGTHWTTYGAMLVMDTLIRYIEANKKINMMRFSMKDLNPSTEAQFSDHDLLDALNLLFIPKKDTLFYPTLTYTDSIGKVKPNVLIVSDSYQQPVDFTGISQRVYNNYGFWYYYKTYHDKTANVKETKEIDLRKEVESKDVIFLMATKANLGNIGWGFIRDVCNLYTDKFKCNSLAGVYENIIKRDANWLQTIRDKAEKDKRPLLDWIRIDAEYMANQEIEKYITEIKQNDKWFKLVKEKAEANNISLEKMIRSDAEYIAIGNKKQ